MPSPRKPRIRARLAGPTGLAAALALGVAGPASASVHHAAVSGPGVGWAPAAAASTDSPLNAMAVLGACGLAGFLLLVLGRRKTPDEPASAVPPPAIDLEAMMLSGREQPGRGSGGPSAQGARRYPVVSTTGGDDGPAPTWVRRLNDQAPPPEPARPVEGAYRG